MFFSTGNSLSDLSVTLILKKILNSVFTDMNLVHGPKVMTHLYSITVKAPLMLYGWDSSEVGTKAETGTMN